MTMLVFGLLLKIAMTASIVVAASVVVERSGPFIGSLIAALPTAGGAAMIILALEHSPEFISRSAVGSLIANAACALFALSYAALAQKHTLRLSLGRSEEHTSELQSHVNLVCRLLLEKKKQQTA